MSIKCNTIENTLFHSEQIGSTGAKSLQTSSYGSCFYFLDVCLMLLGLATHSFES